MLKDIDPQEIRAAVGQRVEVMAFGIPYVGLLERYDEEAARLQIRDGDDVAMVEQERIEEFRVVTTKDDSL